MSVRTKLITTYEPERVIQPIYTGGDVALNEQGRILASSLDEEALLTDLRTGLLLARIEGVRVETVKMWKGMLRLWVGW